MENKQHTSRRQPSFHSSHSSMLMLCDMMILLVVDMLLLVWYPSSIVRLTFPECCYHYLLCSLCLFAARFWQNIYNYVWRYTNTALFIRLFWADFLGGVVYCILQRLMPFQSVTFIRVVAMIAIDLLACVMMRLIYQYLYEGATVHKPISSWIIKNTAFLTGLKVGVLENTEGVVPESRINIAIVGAGRVGVSLATDLMVSTTANYRPCCFIDVDREKVGKMINGLPVISEESATRERLATFPIQEIVLALPEAAADRKKELYAYYKKTGCKIKVYDYPVARSVEGSKRQLREFDVEELLFRAPVSFLSEETTDYYQGKVILISGGGGSIGSELCRQIAAMQPREIVILDVYENCAYDLQQEMRRTYGNRLKLSVEIVNVTDKGELTKVFRKYRPDVVLHAAAHKHVPLMEVNCSEAIKNNVFGTLNMVEVSEEEGVRKFIMISTDKAVNPTNVMGATKRMCEMIIQSRTGTATSFSATRFGNVLGSNGSVIPLFKRQIAEGGPVTLTDKRIIRYFMTIPEASQLVLTSGAMAQKGELYVLDMGQPVHILELAESMIRLSGLEPYVDIDIVETGLRPGEKLYEELLVKTEELDRTENSMIFVERDKPLPWSAIQEKLVLLAEAAATNDDEICRQALMKAVPTYHLPEEVNAAAHSAEEMKQAK